MPPTEVIYVRVPEALKIACDGMAAKHEVSLTSLVTRALEVYLEANGVTVERAGRLP